MSSPPPNFPLSRFFNVFFRVADPLPPGNPLHPQRRRDAVSVRHYGQGVFEFLHPSPPHHGLQPNHLKGNSIACPYFNHTPSREFADFFQNCVPSNANLCVREMNVEILCTKSLGEAPPTPLSWGSVLLCPKQGALIYGRICRSDRCGVITEWSVSVLCCSPVCIDTSHLLCPELLLRIRPTLFHPCARPDPYALFTVNFTSFRILPKDRRNRISWTWDWGAFRTELWCTQPASFKTDC